MEPAVWKAGLGLLRAAPRWNWGSSATLDLGLSCPSPGSEPLAPPHITSEPGKQAVRGAGDRVV